MKYRVTIQFERTQDIVVEAGSSAEAIDLVNNGDFDNENIVDTTDDYVEILGAKPE